MMGHRADEVLRAGVRVVSTGQAKVVGMSDGRGLGPGRAGGVQHWLSTETGSTLHLFDENAVLDDVDDPFMAAGYRALALCRSGAKTVTVAGYVPTADPTEPLPRPRTRLDLIDVAAGEWAPIVAVFDALDALEAPVRAALLEWHAWWFAIYDNPVLHTEHLAARLAAPPVASPLAVPLARAGASGILGCCRRCRSVAAG